MDDFLDDPIADLLSEGSNDSFFADPKQSKAKKPTKPVSNVFDFDEESKNINEDIVMPDAKLNMEIKPVKPTQPSESKERRLSLEKSDINDLLDTQEPKKSKTSVMNEILGISDTDDKKPFTFDDILKSSSLKKDVPPKKDLPVKNPVPEPEREVLSIPPASKEPRRGRRGSTNIDPLGLLDIPAKSPVLERKKPEPDFFKSDNTDIKIKPSSSADILGSADDKKQPEILTKTSKSVHFLDTKESSLFSEFSTQRGRRDSVKKQSAEQSDLPDWLRGAGSGSSQPSEFVSVSTVPSSQSLPTSTVPSTQSLPSSEPPKKQVEKLNVETKMPTESVPAKTLTDQPDFGSLPPNVLDSLFKQQTLSTSSMELQHSSLALQQQETQLMIALQLKKYEQNLADMQRTQQDILMKQEQQFNVLIEKQFAKQKMMEENMRLQQERINQHIQLLLSQPVSSNIKYSLEQQEKKEDILKETFEENRAFYNDIISSLKQKHQEEIGLLEESYRKQLNFLQTSLESTENRLKLDIDNTTGYYTAKLTELSTKHEETVQEYEEKIKKINEENEKLMQELKDNYNELVKDIKNEYKLMIEDINKVKTRDEEVISSAGVFTEKLNTSIEILQNNTSVVNDMQNSIRNEKSFFNDIKAESLSAKEQEIKMMHASLEKQRAASDTERAQLLALVKTLEMRLVEQTQAAREERWTLQQATATIAARALAIDKEMEYMKNNVEYEREQLKNLKEHHLIEHEKIIAQLTEEKLAIATEKSRLETTSKLNQNYDLSRGKAEIEAALQVAKEATELTDRERENLCRKQSELETYKRVLQDRERKLHLKEQELDNIARISDQKYKDGEKALLEARMMESRCNERMRDIQRHTASLANREKKLAEDKISLSRERLAIHSTGGENRCSLCKVENQNLEGSIHEDNVVEQDHSESYKIQDIELLRLKYDLEDTIPTSIREND